MKKMVIWVLLAGIMFAGGSAARAEAHRATRLGNPATRFAPPMHAPEDLRERFRDPKLRKDIDSVLDQSGWTGNQDDIFRAAETADISEVTIPVGTVLPFMSSREKGRPVCLFNVTWAGKEPITAYEFKFTSNGRRYACITPKPCSNFFVEDLGPEPKPALALECEVPPRMPSTRPVKVYLTVRNTGDGVEPQTTITLPIPDGASVTNATDNGIIGAGAVTWQVSNLAPGSSQKVRATVVVTAPTTLSFHSTATGTADDSAQSDCETEMFPVHSILVEVIDLADPIQIGQNVNYVIKITNQSENPDTNLRLVCTVPPSQEFVSGTGITAVQADGRTLTMDPVPSLAGKAVATWQVVTKALEPDDSRFKVEVTGDQFEEPIHREESTHLY